ncbi:MAG: DUF4156 domain-containing protein [Polyangiaceae bacterium]
MRGLDSFSFVLIAGVCGIGCASDLPDKVALQPSAENVEIAAEPPSPNDYKLVGTVTGAAAANDPQAAEVAAKNDLRNKAAALGASLVTVDEDTGEGIPLQDKTEVKVRGRAYKAVEE